MKKILALVLMVAMLCCMMVSCEKTDDLLAKADDALKNEPYKVTMKSTFKADNEQLNAILSATEVEVPVIVDGENVSMELNIPELGIEGAKIIVVDQVMYMSLKVASTDVKFKIALTDEEFAEFMEENNATMPVDYKYYDKYEMEKDGDKKVITCKELNEDGKKMLKERAAGMLNAMNNDSDVDYDEIDFELVIKDGKYDSQKMVMDYTIEVEGLSAEITATMKSSYDYSDEYKITAPKDADSYTEMDYKDVFGK